MANDLSIQLWHCTCILDLSGCCLLNSCPCGCCMDDGEGEYDWEADALQSQNEELYVQHSISERELQTEKEDNMGGYDSYEAALEAFDQEYPNIVVHDEQAASDNQCICNDCIGLVDCGCVYPAVCEHCDIPF